LRLAVGVEKEISAQGAPALLLAQEGEPNGVERGFLLAAAVGPVLD
jgi:hypothetical protein